MSHGPLMLDIAGPELSDHERELLQHPAAGGVILFSRNFVSPEQVEQLVAEIHNIRRPSLLVAVDQEGGRVQRFRKGFTRLPPAAWYGQLYQRNQSQGLLAARAVGWLMAAELRSVGIDFSFAPVLDLGVGVSRVIGDRAFHEKPIAVAELAHSWMSGVHEAGMAAVAKHFPGHGGVLEDSHLSLPIDRRPRGDILMDDLLPFRRLITDGIEAVMPAHVVYSDADSELAGFSKFWLQDVLRGELGFQGVVFSDDLTMAAAGAAGGYRERARFALKAGCDMILVCNNAEGAELVLEELKEHLDPAAQMRLVRMHGRKKIVKERLHLDPRWHQAVEVITRYQDNPELELGI